jgi:hypothetical protein
MEAIVVDSEERVSNLAEIFFLAKEKTTNTKLEKKGAK